MNDTLFYNIGGRVIKISSPPFNENRFLGVFRCGETTADEEFEISFVNNISFPESSLMFGDGYPNYYADGSRTMKIEKGDGILFKDTVAGKKHFVEFLESQKSSFGNNTILQIISLPDMVIDNGGFLLHASFIEHNGSAILFTADKQVGKSTQAALWEKYRGANIVNGDRALIAGSDGGYVACGSPYCGTSNICFNRNLPLKAIVILSQAPVNSARRATAHEAVCALLSGASYNTSDVKRVNRVADTIDKIIDNVPIFCLECTADIRAIEALEAIF